MTPETIKTEARQTEAMQNDAVIHCQNVIPAGLSFDYPGNTLDLDISHGELISIIGPNYCGKAHWLKTICGLEDPRSGQVIIDGINTLDLSAEKWTRTRLKVGYIHADTALMSAVNGLVNTIIPAVYHRLDLKSDRATLIEKAKDMLNEIDPDINLSDLPAHISKEHRFKIAIARTLMLEPEVLVLNDPFAHFNKESKTLFQSFLQKQLKKGLSLLVVTHDTYYAINTSDKIIFVDKEHLYQFNSKQAILNCNISAVENFLKHNLIRHPKINQAQHAR